MTGSSNKDLRPPAADVLNGLAVIQKALPKKRALQAVGGSAVSKDLGAVGNAGAGGDAVGGGGGPLGKRSRLGMLAGEKEGKEGEGETPGVHDSDGYDAMVERRQAAARKELLAERIRKLVQEDEAVNAEAARVFKGMQEAQAVKVAQEEQAAFDLGLKASRQSYEMDGEDRRLRDVNAFAREEKGRIT